MLEKWKDALDQGVLAVSVKSEALVEAGRVRAALNAARRNMDEAVNELGFTVYNAWLSGLEDPNAQENACKRVQDLHREILALQERLERIQAGGRPSPEGPRPQTAPFCAACGRKLAPGSRFCDQCGAPAER